MWGACRRKAGPVANNATPQPATFPSDFLFGVATAAYQVEGAAREGGRGPSIWDTFAHAPGKTAHGHTGDVACDQFHRWAEDVALMRDLGVGAYRFSIAWPRIFPEGTGRANPRGFDYYERLVDALLEAGIEPCPTLYHWDLPQALEDQGGWPARATAEAFAGYARTCFDALGDRVRTWMTLNEPFCSAVLGYGVGVHAPGVKDRSASYRAIHHLLLGHGLAVRAFREAGLEGRVGLAQNAEPFRPATARPEDVEAADRAMDLQVRMFLGPLFGKGYPERHLAAYPDRPMPIEPGDLDVIAEPIDFFGLNMYRELTVAHHGDHPEGYRTVPQWEPTTAMGWPITPGGLARVLRLIDREYDHPAIYVTENGCAMTDVLSEGGTRCHDPARIDFLRGYLGACLAARGAGVDLRGYFLWSLIDNFEWAEGYTKRFGLLYCDYDEDLRRVPKDSFYWYRDLMARRALP